MTRRLVGSGFPLIVGRFKALLGSLLDPTVKQTGGVTKQPAKNMGMADQESSSSVMHSAAVSVRACEACVHALAWVACFVTVAVRFC